MLAHVVRKFRFNTFLMRIAQQLYYRTTTDPDPECHPIEWYVQCLGNLAGGTKFIANRKQVISYEPKKEDADEALFSPLRFISGRGPVHWPLECQAHPAAEH